MSPEVGADLIETTTTTTTKSNRNDFKMTSNKKKESFNSNQVADDTSPLTTTTSSSSTTTETNEPLNHHQKHYNNQNNLNFETIDPNLNHQTINNYVTNSTSNNEIKISHQEELSPVHRMFEGQSVFITGASGFIGRVLLEKLLRTYKGLKNVYILMRTKKNQLPSDRLHKQLLNVPIFDKIRSMKDGREIIKKIIVIPGDISLINLGINQEHLNLMLMDKTLSIVFHSAATIKFDEPLRTSIQLNLTATQTIINFCKKLPNLIGLCHVSTAYVNSDIKDNTFIEERLYPFKDDPEQLINLANILDENLMQILKSRLVDQRPNTYTYTKAAAEHLVFEAAHDLPVSIVRPSIVVASWKEPLEGWVDNLNGPTGLILAIGKGLLRTMYCNVGIKADIVPVDIVVNSMIASVYYTAKINNRLPEQRQQQQLMGSINNKQPTNQNITNNISQKSNGFLANQQIQTTKTLSSPPNGINNNNNTTYHNQNETITNNKLLGANNNRKQLVKQTPITSTIEQQQQQQQKDVNYDDDDNGNDKKGQRLIHPIIHCNSGELNPLKWADCERMFFPIVRKYPSCQVLRYPYGTFKTNKFHDQLTRIFVHFLPALILDIISGLLGKKRQLLSIYKKVHQATGALTHFCTQNYNFKTKNIKKLELALEHPLDKEELFMDIEKVDWIHFWNNYILGARRFVLKEPDETLAQARKSFRRYVK